MIDRFFENKWAPLAVVLAVAGATMLPGIGSYPLLPEWEPHYGQVVREMIDRGEWLDPTYRGEPFFDKPVLPFFLECASLTIFGENEFAIRLPMAGMGIFGVFAFFFLLSKIYDKRTAFIGGVMLATTPFYYLIARQFMFDMPFVALETGALLCLVLGAIPKKDGEEQPHRRRYLAGMWVLLGLASLSKGLLAIAVPGCIGIVYILITFDWRVIKRLEVWWGLPLMLAVASPWYIFMTIRHGTGFLEEFFLEHHVDRMQGELDKPTGTFEFYIREIGVGLMPWVLALPLGFAHAFGDWKAKLDQKMWRESFLRLAFLAPFVFFTLSSTKFPHYVLPSIPFLVLIMARGIAKELEDPETRSSRLLWVLGAVVLGLIAKDLLEGRNYRYVFYLFTTHKLQDFHPLVANPFVAFSAIFGLSGLVVLVAMFRRKLAWQGFLVLLALNLSYAFYVNTKMVPGLCHMFSSRSLIEQYMALAEEGDPLADYRSWKTRAMTFYLPLDNPLTRISSAGSLRGWRNRFPGQRLFITVEERNLSQLRRAARQAGEQLFVVGDDGYEDYHEILLVSNRPNEGASDPRGQAVLTSAPSPENPSEAVFGNKIRLLGTDVQPDVARRDGTLRITYYFECLQDMEEDYQVFNHITALSGGTHFVDNHHPFRSRLPTSMWRQGDIVRDEFTVTVPTAAVSGEYRVMMGFFSGDSRQQVSEGANDGQNRTEAIRFEVN